MDSSTLEDLYSYYLAFGSITSTSSSTSIRATSTAISFGQSSSLTTTYPFSSVTSTKQSSSTDISTVSVPSGVSTTTSGSQSTVIVSVTTPTLSSTASTTISPSSIGGIGPLATTVVLPIGVHFDISLSAWVGAQDSLFYWVSLPNVNPIVANIETGAWIHLDPENAQYFHGFTIPVLAGTTWLIHVTVEHPDNSASLFDIRIVVEERVDRPHTSALVVSSPSASEETSATPHCPKHTASSSVTTASKYSSPSGAAIGLGPIMSSVSAMSALVTAAAITAATGYAVKDGFNGLNIDASSSSTTTVLATATATEDTPVDAVQTLVSHSLLDIPLGQYLQNASEDKVDSWSVTPSIAGYNSDWILFDADNATLYGIVPRSSRNVTLLVTVAAASHSQNTTYFLSVKLIITGQISTPSPSFLPASTARSHASLSSTLFPLASLALSSNSPSTSSLSTFAGWNFTATSTRRGVYPTPFWPAKSGTRPVWPSSQLSWNDTAINASRTVLPAPYNFGNGVGPLPPHLNTANNTVTATTNSIPSFTITLWTTATAYYNPCPTCPLQATVVSIATGVTQIPVEVFMSYMPEATVTVMESETENEGSATPATSSGTVEVVATMTRMVTVTTVASASQETGRVSSGRSLTVVTSTVSGNFVSGRENAASLTGVSLWVLMSTPVVVVLGVDLLF